VTTTEPQSPPDTEAILRRVLDIIAATRALPLSSSVRLDNKDEVVELLQEGIERLPDEVKAARWMLKEREEFLARMQREADEIVEVGRRRAEEMVENTEIVREARNTARRVIEAAREDARRLRLETEDYCDQKLASFEIVLERTIKTVAAGRQKLSLVPSTVFDSEGRLIAGVDPGEETIGGEDAFFDQDRQ
jgi:cell division septum initiation protein DivIVA